MEHVDLFSAVARDRANAVNFGRVRTPPRIVKHLWTLCRGRHRRAQLVMAASLALPSSARRLPLQRGSAVSIDSPTLNDQRDQQRGLTRFQRSSAFSTSSRTWPETPEKSRDGGRAARHGAKWASRWRGSSGVSPAGPGRGGWSRGRAAGGEAGRPDGRVSGCRRPVAPSRRP